MEELVPMKVEPSLYSIYIDQQPFLSLLTILICILLALPNVCTNSNAIKNLHVILPLTTRIAWISQLYLPEYLKRISLYSLHMEQGLMIKFT